MPTRQQMEQRIKKADIVLQNCKDVVVKTLHDDTALHQIAILLCKVDHLLNVEEELYAYELIEAAITEADGLMNARDINKVVAKLGLKNEKSTDA